MSTYTFKIKDQEYTETLTPEQEAEILKDRPGILIYKDKYRSVKKRLTNEQKGRLFDAIYDYQDAGIIPDFSDDPFLDLAFEVVEAGLDHANNEYILSVLSKRKRGTLGGRPKKEAEEGEETP